MSNLKDFVALADYLDDKGFFEAADIIDGLVEKQAEKMEEAGRREAKKIRLRRLADKKPFDLPYLFERHEEKLEEGRRIADPIVEEIEAPAYEEEEEEGLSGSEYELLDLFEGDQDVDDVLASLDVDIEKVAQQVDVQQLGQRLRLDPRVLQTLTPEQLNSVNRMRNTGIARQWVSHFQRQNVRQRTQLPAEQQPGRAPARQPAPATPATAPAPAPAPAPQARQPAPQPAQQPARQPAARPSTSLRGPGKFEEYMRKLYGPSQAPGPGELTQKDMPQQLTRKDFPEEIKF